MALATLAIIQTYLFKFKTRPYGASNSGSVAWQVTPYITAEIGERYYLIKVVCCSFSTFIEDENFSPVEYFHHQVYDKFIIDVDGGADDAVAMFLGLYICPKKILAFTTVVGNTDLNQVNKNVLKILKITTFSNVSILF